MQKNSRYCLIKERKDFNKIGLLLGAGVGVAESPVAHVQAIPTLVPVVLVGHGEVALHIRHRVHQQVVHCNTTASNPQTKAFISLNNKTQFTAIPSNP